MISLHLCSRHILSWHIRYALFTLGSIYPCLYILVFGDFQDYLFTVSWSLVSSLFVFHLKMWDLLWFTDIFLSQVLSLLIFTHFTWEHFALHVAAISATVISHSRISIHCYMFYYIYFGFECHYKIVGTWYTQIYIFSVFVFISATYFVYIITSQLVWCVGCSRF